MKVSILAAALTAGVGTTRAVETAKEFTDWLPYPWMKSTFASAVAGATGAVLVDGDWRVRTAAGMGAAGVAMLTHETATLLRLVADRQRIIVTSRVR